MATSAGARDVFTAIFLMAFVLLATGAQLAPARSYSDSRSSRATVKNFMPMLFVMNDVSVPPMATRSVAVDVGRLTITVTVIKYGKHRRVSTVPVPQKYLLDFFVLELRACAACSSYGGCTTGALCLRASTRRARRIFQICSISLQLPTATIVVLPVLPPVSLPPVTLPPVALRPVSLPPGIVPPLRPIVAPIVAPIAPILAPFVNPIVPILAPIVNPLAPILAPVINPLVPIVAPIVAPVVAPLTPTLAPIVAPNITTPLAPITAPVVNPLLPPASQPCLP